MMIQMRNDTQQKASISVENANRLLEQVADLNKQIKANLNLGRTVATLEDLRDSNIKELSQEIQITFFTRGDGVLVVQTSQGQQLADENAAEIFFDPTPIGSTSYYPASAAGLYIGGDPAEEPAAFDITRIDVGGNIGAYLDMRDNVLPQYQAQLDELAYRMASRFNAQGVRLFTDDGGQIPADTNPIPNPPGPLTPVSYVGYASKIQVNDAIINDNTLLRTSTLANVNVQQGSSEFLRRVVEFAFGKFEYLQAQGNVDVRVAALPDTLQNMFGLNPRARVVGDVDIRTLSTGVALNTAPNNPFLPPSGPPLLDDFTLRFDPSGVNDTGDISIDLGTVDALYPTPPALSGADALVTYLNTDIIPALAPPLNAPGAITVQLNQFGQLVINSQYDVRIGSGTMGDTGLGYLGLDAGTTPAISPYFDIQVGKDNIARVDVDPSDTEATLLAKLNAISGVQATVDPGTGFLNIRPGPNFGGDIRLIDGPIFSSGGNSILTELFGSANVITGVNNAPFRGSNLGADARQSTNIIAPDSLIDYSQKMVAAQSEDASVASSQLKDEQSFHDLLERRFLDESSVN
ncbi:MAG TPA: flagellar hook-associated protein FlgK, partial [Micavibrio sp.]